MTRTVSFRVPRKTRSFEQPEEGVGVGYIDKQPYEAFTIDIDFSENFDDGDFIDEISVTATDSEGESASSVIVDQSSITDSGGRVYMKLQGGTVALSMYEVRVRIKTDLEAQWEFDLTVEVLDT
jgi:hypothetical protein